MQKGFTTFSLHERGFAQPLLIFIFAAVLISGGVFLYTQNTTFTPKTKFQNIQTSYTNKTSGKDYTSPLGFSFKYSNDLIVKEDNEENFNKRGNGDFRKNFTGYVQYEPGKFLGAIVVLEKAEDFDTNPFSVWVFDNPSDLSIDAWYKNYWYYPFVWGDFTYKGKFELAPKDEATISGQVVKFGVIDYQSGKPKFVYLSKDKKMYLFRIIGDSGDKILQTFKFLQ